MRVYVHNTCAVYNMYMQCVMCVFQYICIDNLLLLYSIASYECVCL